MGYYNKKTIPPPPCRGPQFSRGEKQSIFQSCFPDGQRPKNAIPEKFESFPVGVKS